MKHWLYILAFFSLNVSAFAQTYRIQGRVLDADTKEGLPFINVYFSDKSAGTETDDKGAYTFTTPLWYDTLEASAIGFVTVKKPIKKDTVITIDFYINSTGLDLQEVVFLAGENPANRIVRGIIKNKDQTRTESLDALQYESYAKVELDLENIGPKLRKSKLMEPFALYLNT